MSSRCGAGSIFSRLLAFEVSVPGRQIPSGPRYRSRFENFRIGSGLALGHESHGLDASCFLLASLVQVIDGPSGTLRDAITTDTDGCCAAGGVRLVAWQYRL